MTVGKRNWRFLIAAACAGLLVVGVASSARAQAVSGADLATARALFDEGRQLLRDNRLAEACPKLQESARIAPLGGTLLNLADCYEKQGLLATAWSAFLSAASASSRSGKAEREQEARARAEALVPRLPRLLIDIQAVRGLKELEIKRDDSVVGEGQWGVAIPLDPGSHRVVVRAVGYREWKTTIEAKPGETATLQVPVLAPEERTASKPTVESATSAPQASASSSTLHPPQAPGGRLGVRKTMALTSGGIGAIGAVTGAVFGLVSMSKHDAAQKVCPDGECDSASGIRLWEKARFAGNVSTGAFIVGGVGLAAGAVLWLTASPSELPVQQIGLGPGMLSVRGAF